MKMKAKKSVARKHLIGDKNKSKDMARKTIKPVLETPRKTPKSTPVKESSARTSSAKKKIKTPIKRVNPHIKIEEYSESKSKPGERAKSEKKPKKTVKIVSKRSVKDSIGSSIQNSKSISERAEGNSQNRSKNQQSVSSDQRSDKVSAFNEAKTPLHYGVTTKISKKTAAKTVKDNKKIISQMNKITEDVEQRVLTKTQQRQNKLNPGITLNQLVDLNKLGQKSDISTFDFLLALIEVSINSFNYGTNFSAKTTKFWEDIKSREQFANIFNQYKADTLRKIWIRLGRIHNDINETMDILQRNKSIINKTNPK